VIDGTDGVGRPLAENPWTWLNSRPVLRTLAALLCCAGLACAAAPASTPAHLIARGVTVSGVRVGGLTAEPARQRVTASLLRPIRIATPEGVTNVEPARLGAVADVDAAVTAALIARPRLGVTVPVEYSAARAAGIVSDLAARFDRPPVDASVIGADADGPQFSPARPGIAVDRRTMGAAIGELLRSGARDPLTLLTTVVPPKRTVANFGPVIVVTRGANTLRLYRGAKLVRTFRVATGQAVYPTPAGIWRIVDKQRNPWWYPPTYDDWAKGLKPVPPGPSNPLGTRWMGLSAPGVGIHGTDAPTSIGYSASHGCIRMQVPEAEWLFEHVRVGTPVVIL
jgi:lipoprotein-anchoring transpeptidase ErfK/SrfK